MFSFLLWNRQTIMLSISTCVWVSSSHLVVWFCNIRQHQTETTCILSVVQSLTLHATKNCPSVDVPTPVRYDKSIPVSGCKGVLESSQTFSSLGSEKRQVSLFSVYITAISSWLISAGRKFDMDYRNLVNLMQKVAHCSGVDPHQLAWLHTESVPEIIYTPLEVNVLLVSYFGMLANNNVLFMHYNNGYVTYKLSLATAQSAL